MKRRYAVLTSVAAIAALAASATPAAAAPVTPTGFCGARNMVNDNARPHMVEAMMEHTAPQGDAGMFAAVARTTCD